MFCPDGYTTLADVHLRLGHIAVERSRELFPGKVPYDEYFAAGSVEMLDAEINYHVWLQAQFLRSQSDRLYAISPTGGPLRLDENALSMSRTIRGPYPEGPAEQKSLAEHLMRGYFFYIEPNYLTISGSAFAMLDNVRDEQEREANSHSEVLQTAARILAPLEGWPVCWKNLKPVTTDDDLHRVCRAQAASEAYQSELRRSLLGGRPRIQEPLLEHYRLHFPHGHAGKTIKEVLKAITLRGGPVASVDTLRTALRNIETQNSEKPNEKP